jgi:hypothetical protein
MFLGTLLTVNEFIIKKAIPKDILGWLLLLEE